MSPSSPTSPTDPRVASRSNERRHGGAMIAVIINPISGGPRPGQAEARAQAATDAVRQHGEDAQVFVTTHGGHAHELAKTAAAAGARLVIAWGGDGTINEAAS